MTGLLGNGFVRDLISSLSVRGVIVAMASLLVIPSIQAIEPEEEVKKLSEREVDFLLRNCSDITTQVSSGVAIVYGEVIEAPLLITVDKDRILINSDQVYPVQKRRPDFSADKVAFRLHAQLYLEEQRGATDSVGNLEHRLQEAKSQGRISNFRVTKHDKTSSVVEVLTSEGKSRIFSNHLPMPLWEKDAFIVNCVVREYVLRKESAGKKASVDWLTTRLQELQSLGVVKEFKFDGGESVNITFPRQPAPMGYYIGEAMSPHAIAYAKSWKSRRAETEKKAAWIEARLAANDIVIFSFSFDKAVPMNPLLIGAVRGVQESRDIKSNLDRLRLGFGISDIQANRWAEEVR